MAADFDTYFHALAATFVDDKTEHMDRSALEALLKSAAEEAAAGTRVIHEPRHDRDGGGSPDFKITRAGRITGYAEVKTIDENLSKVLKSAQIRKYRTLSDNIIVTDYLEFCWIRADGEIIRHRLANSEDLASRKLRLKPESVEAVRLLLRGFFTAAPQKIARARDLALALASRAGMLRDFLGTELNRQSQAHDKGRLHALFEVFRSQIFHELEVAEFADAFAQMLAYGLFLARLNAGDSENVTLGNVRSHIPGSFVLIRELVRFIEEMDEKEYADIHWVVEEILSIVNGLDLAAIHNDLSFRARKAVNRKVRAGDEEEHRLFERDPFIYFYEDFLKAYDPAMRKGRGVYYTPPPVVNFIVRAVDDILKGKFGIADGLADHKRVTVLDFACGTGTFLLEIFQQIFDNIGGADSGKADLIVREHLARNLFGFEYLIAPYTIAHLKLSQYLRDQGHALKKDERLQVFLTNTLEPIKPQRDLNFPAISAEVEAAQRVKDREILVITGNPPYSGHSKNKGDWTTRSIDGYKYTVERRVTGQKNGVDIVQDVNVPLGEKNPKWLNDDYVKFIRFAQLKMDAVSEGVVGIITNHSWLDNPTFRGMRQSLMRSFDQIYVLDLHGNAKKKEKAPDGSKDENVFDIEQGVAISLFVKKAGLEKGVWRGDLWGKRLEKYHAVMGQTLSEFPWSRLQPNGGYCLFDVQNVERRKEYVQGWKLTDIFEFKTMGMITKRDALTIAINKDEIWNRVVKFSSTPEIDLRDTFRLQPDNDWSSINALKDLKISGPDKKYITEIIYAPFDFRYTYYTGKTRGFLARPVLENMRHLSGRHVALSFTRKIDVNSGWNHVFVVNRPMTHHAVSMKEGNYVIPLRVSAHPQPAVPISLTSINPKD